MSSSKSVPARTVNRSRVADQIFRELRDQIMLGTLPKGSKLPTERELAERYGVSGPTVREAVRGLTAMGLIDVRHGSGAYVTADTTSLIAMSLGAVIRLENLGATDVLSVLGCLIVHAAGLAARSATEADKARLLQALEQLDMVETVEAATVALRAFNGAIALATHNPLLAILYGFLGDLLTELGVELAEQSMKTWRQMFDKLKPLRQGLVEAITSGDAGNATRLAEKFHSTAVATITSLPKANEVRLKDPHFGSLLLQMMNRLDAR